MPSRNERSGKKLATIGLLSALGVLSTPAIAQAASPSFGGYSLPEDYFNRFGLTTVVATNATGASGFGVRYLPIPLKTDLRISVVKRPKYWEYSVYSRQHDTTFQAGIFDNGDAASAGIPRLELTHDPYRGLQYSAYLQDQAHVSRFSAGYALPIWENRFRVLNNVGVAFQNDVVAPFTYSEIGGGYGQPVTPKFSAGVWLTARLYTFPAQQQYQASIDMTPHFEARPIERTEVTASHLERFAKGTVAIPDFNLARYQETNASVSYRFNTSQDFSLNMLRTRVTRDWTNKRTYLYNDVLFRFNALPVLVGPTIGYQWWPNKADTRWLFGFSTAGK